MPNQGLVQFKGNNWGIAGRRGKLANKVSDASKKKKHDCQKQKKKSEEFILIGSLTIEATSSVNMITTERFGDGDQDEQ